LAYATGSAELAITVRGSSRRIKIMRFRPANIRLINRRLQLPRLLLVLSSKNHKSKDDQTHESRRLTGSLHIRPSHSPNRSLLANGRITRLIGRMPAKSRFGKFPPAEAPCLGKLPEFPFFTKIRLGRYLHGSNRCDSDG
jgi:hypothetical protein